MALILANQQPTRATVDLKMQYNPAWIPAASEYFTLKVPDFTQLGLRRNQLPKEGWFPTNRAVDIVFQDVPVMIARKLNVNRANTRQTTMVVSLDFSGLRTGQLSDTQVRALQTALSPSVVDEEAAVRASDEYTEAVQKLRAEAEALYPLLAAQLIAICQVQLDKLDRVSSLLGAQEVDENATVTAIATITPERLAALTYIKWQTLLALVPDLKDVYGQAVQQVTWVKMQSEYPTNTALLHHPVFAATYDQLAAKYRVKEFHCPLSVAQAMSDTGRLVAFTIALHTTTQDGTNPEEKHVDEVDLQRVPDGIKGFIGALAVFTMEYNHTAATTDYEKCLFAYTRWLQFREGWLLDSQELCEFTLPEIKYDWTEMCAKFKDQDNRSELFYAATYCSAISFLKSGHHATAFNLPNTMSKLAGALGQALTPEEAVPWVRCAVYHGAHVGSMRLIIAHAWMAHQSGNITGAVAYRLHPTPPLFAAYINLSLFVESLAMIRFFEFMGKNDDLVRFRGAIARMKSVMHFCAPYSNYLYGSTLADPTNDKQIAAEFASLAIALNAAIPNSSLGLSPSLAKLAANAANVNVGAHLQVEAFIVAYRRFHVHLVTSQLRTIAGIKAAEVE